MADRLWPGTEGWFAEKEFSLARLDGSGFEELASFLKGFAINNTMSAAQHARLKFLSVLKKADLQKEPRLENEKKSLEALRRESPIVLGNSIHLEIDWFLDDQTGGSRLKTWAGQQSVINIATAMHEGLKRIPRLSTETLWSYSHGGGLPFNFDSDLVKRET